MKVYLLWYNDWEENSIVGVFETREEAQRWKDYFIVNPDVGDFSWSMSNNSAASDLEARLDIEEYEIGKLHSRIKIDNLKYLEYMDKEIHER